MTANLYQGQVAPVQVVGEAMKTRLSGPVAALKQGSVGPTMSDMQFMMENERKQHEDAYRYAHGAHASDNVPLGNPSF